MKTQYKEKNTLRTTSGVQNQNSQKEDSSNFLSLYFREMSSLALLNGEEEIAIAKKIETLEIQVWVEILSQARMTQGVLKWVDKKLQSPPSFRALRRCATACQKEKSKAKQEKLVASILSIGEALRDSDKDALVLEALIAYLAMGRGSAPLLSMFSTKEEKCYLGRIQEASRRVQGVRNHFVKVNLRLVVSIAKRYNHGRLSFADLIQEGNLGLIKAVRRFDYRRGFRFSTYASWWIRHAISRGQADKGREVRIPVHMIDAHYRVNKAWRGLSAKLFRAPTVEELSEETELSIGKIEKMRTYLLDGSLSLDKPINDEDGRTLGESLEDPRTSGDVLFRQLSGASESQRVRSLLEALKPMEADILRQRFGFDDDQEHTLKEIGSRYNLSRERIRQLQEKALDKMRKAMAKSTLLDSALLSTS